MTYETPLTPPPLLVPRLPKVHRPRYKRAIYTLVLRVYRQKRQAGLEADMNGTNTHSPLGTGE